MLLEVAAVLGEDGKFVGKSDDLYFVQFQISAIASVLLNFLLALLTIFSAFLTVLFEAHSALLFLIALLMLGCDFPSHNIVAIRKLHQLIL